MGHLRAWEPLGAKTAMSYIIKITEVETNRSASVRVRPGDAGGHDFEMLHPAGEMLHVTCTNSRGAVAVAIEEILTRLGVPAEADWPS